MNELQLYSVDDPVGQQGYRTLIAGPEHPPYRQFIPAPGHGLGFNELKVIECHELLMAIGGDMNANVSDFDKGLEIEQVVHAMARSAEAQCWVDV
ncbi:hypothetical protein [Rhizobium giardinii]|uniref:Gfo/Idh/MocA-like oxidoreductase C-terminal domain-containing protein n=1 Tax=Rhizobium giardinii TaxID=56731 RepID=A0A7W8UHW8_9HYPH|nr:hypothetical protein [Rhizobium giardinii]MBB5539109.1 hypothetical protein [Rhizobium giardinii]